MKYYNKNKELSYIQFQDINNLYNRAMSQKFPVNNFDYLKGSSQFDKHFIKN